MKSNDATPTRCIDLHVTCVLIIDTILEQAIFLAKKGSARSVQEVL